MDAARQPTGIPVGGQFAANSHAEPDVSLEATTPSPRQHIPDRHALLVSQAARRQFEVSKMLTEQDKLSMEAVSSGILRDYPTATELRVEQNFGGRGERFNSNMASVRDKDGTNLTEGTPDWDYKASPGGERSIYYSFTDIRAQFFDYENDFEYDGTTHEVIVPLNRDYAEGIQLV